MADRLDRDLALYDPETAEVVSFVSAGSRIETKEEFEARTSFLASANETKRLSRTLGNNFIWVVSSVGKPLLPQLSVGTLARLVYLSSFLLYENKLMLSQKKPMTKSDLETVLGCSRSQTWRFTSEVVDAGMLIINDDKSLSLNGNVFRKGKLKKDEIALILSTGGVVNRVYVETVRSLYSGAKSANEISTMGYLYRIMPCVNREFNVCCTNQMETVGENVRAMSLSQIGKIAGYDPSHNKRLFKSLCGLCVCSKGNIYPAVGLAGVNTIGVDENAVYINPRVYYGGNNSSISTLLSSFKKISNNFPTIT